MAIESVTFRELHLQGPQALLAEPTLKQLTSALTRVTFAFCISLTLAVIYRSRSSKKFRVRLFSMPSHTVQGQPNTPARVRNSFAIIVDRLNILGLQIPSLHGSQETALQQADAAHSLAKKCAGQLRFLCFRDCDLEKLISEFEEDARRIRSEWVFKPSQEKGTIPQPPIATSFISRISPPDPEQRQKLLERLNKHLRDDVKLAKDSDVYKRTSYGDTAGPIQANESQNRASVGEPQGTAAMVSRRQATDAAISPPHQGRSPMRHSREGVKRKSSVSEKV